MAHKIENFEEFFRPLARGDGTSFDQSVVDYLKKHQINMAQEIIQRFGLCYKGLLEQDLTQAQSVRPNLENRVSTIQKRSGEILTQGSRMIETTLTNTSTLSGRSADEIANTYWTILKYLPMASEEVLMLLLCSPEHLWTPLLRASFEVFHKTLEEEMEEGSSQLFALTERSTIPPLEHVSSATKILLSRAAFPLDSQEFLPLLTLLAEWAAYNPHYDLLPLCRLLNISISFLTEKKIALTEQVSKYGFPRGLNFQAFLAYRSASVFCTNTNLELSQNGLKKLIDLFLHDEHLRRSWVFFTTSKELQKLKPSERTALSPHHLLICFWGLRTKVLTLFTKGSMKLIRFLNKDNDETSQQEALSLLASLFEWLIFATKADQEIFFENYSTYRPIQVLTTIQDLKEIGVTSENALKAFFIFMDYYDHLSLISSHCHFCPVPALTFYKWILSGESDMQENFFAAAESPFPSEALKCLGNALLADDQMLPVLTFMFLNSESFKETFLFIEELPLPDLVKQNLKKNFLEYIYENKGIVFIKIKINFQRLFSDLVCKRYPQSVEGDKERHNFYQVCAPIFVWCVKGSEEARVSLFEIGTAFRLEPLLESLKIMRDVEFPDEKKLLLWIGILPHLKYFPDVLTLINSLQKDALKETFFNALCDLEVDWFFTIYLTFLNFKEHIKNADYVFGWMVAASQESLDLFSSLLTEPSPKTLTSSLSLMDLLEIAYEKKLEMFVLVIKHHTFLSEAFTKLKVFVATETSSGIEKAFFDRYIEEIGFIKLHTPRNDEQEEREKMQLCTYVTRNLNTLKELVRDFSFPPQTVLIDLCFDPLTTERLSAFTSYFRSFMLTTKKTPAFYEAFLNFIKERLKEEHINIVENIFRRLQLFQCSYDIFAIMNAFKPESVVITKTQADTPLTILQHLIKECLSPLQAILLFVRLLKDGNDLASKKFQALQLFEKVTSVCLNGEDTFEWMMKYPGADDFFTSLRALKDYRTALEEHREQPSLPRKLYCAISDNAATLHRCLDSYNMEKNSTTSLKRHISTALILPEQPNLFDFFALESLESQNQIEIPLAPRYPHPFGKRIKLKWETPQGEDKTYPKLVILGNHTLEIELPFTMQKLQDYSQILVFTHTLLQDAGKEEKILTGDFSRDFTTFSETTQAQWQSAELHKTDEEKTAIGKAIYKFVLQLKVALRKRRYLLSIENS